MTRANQPEGVERLWHLDPNDLDIPEHRLRAPKGIEGLAQSMADLGQLQPVIVAGDARTVLAGARRVLAARSLGWDLVACVATDADQVLVEIDENLKRQELTAMERIKHLEARRRAYEAAFPETRRGVAGGKARQGAATDTPSFAADVSAKLGVSERTIQRQVRLAQDLDDEACELLQDHDVADNAAELTRLAKLEPEDQRAAAELLAEGRAKTVKAAKRQVEQAKPVADAPEAPPSIDLRLCSVAELITAPFPGRSGGEPYQADLVHADPPWTYGNHGNGSAESHYQTMSVDIILSDIARAHDLSAPDAVLVLWCTWPLLGELHQRIEERMGASAWPWGRVVTGGCWHKEGRIGVGHWWRGQTEPVLVFTKGTPEVRKTILNGFTSQRTAHSEKPTPWLESMVEAWSPPKGRVLDLYAGRAPLARACLATGRSYLGAEIDPHRHAAALQALAGERDERQTELFGGAA